MDLLVLQQVLIQFFLQSLRQVEEKKVHLLLLMHLRQVVLVEHQEVETHLHNQVEQEIHLQYHLLKEIMEEVVVEHHLITNQAVVVELVVQVLILLQVLEEKVV